MEGSLCWELRQGVSEVHFRAIPLVAALMSTLKPSHHSHSKGLTLPEQPPKPASHHSGQIQCEGKVREYPTMLKHLGEINFTLQSPEMALAHRGGLASPPCSAGAELPHLLELLLQNQGPNEAFPAPWIDLVVSFRTQLTGCAGRATPNEPHSTHKLMT